MTPSCAVINISAIIAEDRDKVLSVLNGYEIKEISYENTLRFAGNLECLYSPVKGTEIIIASLKCQDLITLDREIVYIDIDNIETIGGGSTQCMIGKLF